MSGLGFEIRLAARHLRAGKGQTVLTLSTVAAGVVVIVFISSLIFGLRQMFTALLTDLLPQVTVNPVEMTPQPLNHLGDVKTVASQIEAQNPQNKLIDNWPSLCESIKRLPHVVEVTPAVLDQAFASRGGRQVGVIVYGADPVGLTSVINVRKYIVEGHYVGLTSGEIVVVKKLAIDLGVGLGDHIRLASNQGVSTAFKIVGIYDNGSDQELYTTYITLRAAQSLYRTGTSVKSILVKADDLFHADMVADEISPLMPYKIKSWTRQYPQFTTSLAMQSAAAFMISGFSLVAAAFAISSVLIVSVLQKSKEIGILKSMGATRNQIFRVFLLEGFGIAVLGSAMGALAGCGFVIFLSNFKRAQSGGLVPQALFPTQLSLTLVLIAMGAAIVSTVIAATMPARRAASLDPVEVMR